MENLNNLKEYINSKININTEIYHKKFYLNKEDTLLEHDERKIKTYISLCIINGLPSIRLYENGELTEEVYYDKDGIKVNSIINEKNPEVKIPNITKVYNLSKQILEQYNEFEIYTICLSDYSNINDLINDIGWRKRDLKRRVEDIIKIAEHYKGDDYKFSKYEVQKYKELCELLY